MITVLKKAKVIQREEKIIFSTKSWRTTRPPHKKLKNKQTKNMPDLTHIQIWLQIDQCSTYKRWSYQTLKKNPRSKHLWLEIGQCFLRDDTKIYPTKMNFKMDFIKANFWGLSTMAYTFNRALRQRQGVLCGIWADTSGQGAYPEMFTAIRS